MKPKLKQQELEQLVEAQELEAEQEALVQQEQAYSPYRVLEKKETIEDLIGLVEKKKGIERSASEIETRKYSYEISGPVACTSFVAGAVPGMILGLYGAIHSPVLWGWYCTGLLFTLVGSVGGPLGIDYYRKNKSPACKKFYQEKADQLQEKQNELQTIEQELSQYETKYRADDIVLADIPETGLSLGKAVTRYVFSSLNIPDEGGNYMTLIEYTIKNKREIYTNPSPISVLTTSTELSLDDLRSLDKITAIAYQEGNKDSTEYGFAKVENDNFCIYTDAALKFPKRVYPLHLLETVIKNPRILIPVKAGEE